MAFWAAMQEDVKVLLRLSHLYLSNFAAAPIPATVYYAEEESARWAMRDLHKSDFRNRPLEVKFSVPHKVRVIVY